MSTLKLILTDVLDELYSKPSSVTLKDQNFGVGLFEKDLYCQYLMSVPCRFSYCKLWKDINPYKSGISSLETDELYLKINLDVRQFKPDEVSVKIVGDCIVVEAKHDEREDKHGFIARHFTRRYKVAGDVNIEHLISTLSSDGVLTLIAPKKDYQLDEERNIPIVQTNKPALSISVEGS